MPYKPFEKPYAPPSYILYILNVWATVLHFPLKKLEILSHLDI